MPEGFNIEIAHKLAEHEAGATSPRFDLWEIAEAVVLALIAVATAWSGYHAAKWDGHQALLYGHAQGCASRPASPLSKAPNNACWTLFNPTNGSEPAMQKTSSSPMPTGID